MAGKTNTSESQIDKGSFFWTGQCGVCHPGGGPGEFDRAGEKYFDPMTGLFGYEVLGQTAADVQLDGDYAWINTGNGMLMPAPWDVTGVSEPDCMQCHNALRTLQGTMDMNTFWRQATLRSMAALVDGASNPVAAFHAAPTAGMGWHSTLDLTGTPGKPPTAATLQIDYNVGLTDGTLKLEQGQLMMTGESIVGSPLDNACWGCHAFPDLKKRGRIWFDEAEDVHYAAFNNLNDADPSNDIAPSKSAACTVCHPAEMTHEIAKGNAFVGSVRNELDYQDLMSCRDCHAPGGPAPAPTSLIHTVTPKHLETMSCQACHVPFKIGDADLVVDNAATGKTVGYKTNEFLSADPLDPDGADKSKWYPSLHWREDSDGVERVFPAKLLNTVWWGDWNQNGTPADLTDDVIEPIILWRMRQATGAAPLSTVTDDNGDGKPEVNREEEILEYIDTFRTFFDSYGNAIAANPVLIKGGKAWYEDLANPGVLQHFELHGSGIKAESAVPFSMDHNVRPASEALGNCAACHSLPSTVFDRPILIDPFDEDGQPVYTTPREVTGLVP